MQTARSFVSARHRTYILLISSQVLPIRRKEFYLRGAPARCPGRSPLPPADQGRRGLLHWRKGETVTAFIMIDVTVINVILAGA
jgi:hypothetical protein